jgi:hypothetical protein
MPSANKTARSRIEAAKRKQQRFFELAKRFSNTMNPEKAKRLGDKLGRTIFGG